MFAALLTTFLFALTAVCATQAVRYFSAARANLYRLLIASVILQGWLWTYGELIEMRAILWFLTAGVLGFGVGGTCMFQAFPRIGSTLSLLVVECAAALSAAFFGWWWLDAPFSLRQGLFALLSLAGLCIGLAPYKLPHVSRGVLLAGVGFAAVASMVQGMSLVMSKQGFLIQEELGMRSDAVSAAAWRLLGGLVLALLWFVCLQMRKGERIPQDRPTGRFFPAWIVANALTGPVLGMSCMLWAISQVGNPGLVQAVVATATLFSVPLAWWLERRRPVRWYYVGACISIFGTAGLLMEATSGRL